MMEDVKEKNNFINFSQCDKEEQTIPKKCRTFGIIHKFTIRFLSTKKNYVSELSSVVQDNSLTLSHIITRIFFLYII